MKPVVMYSTALCPFCIRAKYLLEQKGVQFEDRRVDLEPNLRAEMMSLSGRHTVPQIWIGDQHIGGCDELYALESSGQLNAFLQGPAEQ